MKVPVHFILIFAVVIIIALVSQSWGAVSIALLCLAVYYARQYYRLVVIPQRQLKEKLKNMQESSSDRK